MADPGFLQSLPDPDREEFLAAVRKRRYGRREIVFHEGDIGDFALMVVNGCLAIRKTGSSGSAAIIAVLGPGDTVGELALVERECRRTATVLALEPTDTLILEREAFSELSRRRPALEQLLTKMLAARIRCLDEQLALALLASVEDRIASHLATLAGMAGGIDGIALTQQDLATLTGTSRATVNRVLGQLAQGGAIEMRRGRIRVIDLDRVAAVVITS